MGSWGVGPSRGRTSGGIKASVLVLLLFFETVLAHGGIACLRLRGGRLGLMDLKRINKEAIELKNDGDGCGVSANSVGNDMTHWKGKITGPDGTPYHGGTFYIDIKLTPSYPFEPPKMSFDTKIWHPNVSSQTGAICLDILKKEWSPALTIKTALLSVQALLAAPEPDDPQDAVVAGEYKRSIEQFNKTAKEWTERYAKGDNTEALKPLTDMGFSEAQVFMMIFWIDSCFS